MSPSAGDRLDPVLGRCLAVVLIYVMIWGFALVCGLTAVYGLTWAIRSGQMRQFGLGASSIFDDEEPVGEMTDAFPGSGRDGHRGGGAPW